MHMTGPYGSWSNAQTLHDAALVTAPVADRGPGPGGSGHGAPGGWGSTSRSNGRRRPHPPVITGNRGSGCFRNL